MPRTCLKCRELFCGKVRYCDKCRLQERSCILCGVLYTPGSAIAKYCNVCRGLAYGKSVNKYKASAKGKAKTAVDLKNGDKESE